MSAAAALAFDIPGLHAAYAEGLSPVEVIAEAYRRIREADDPGIFLHLRPEAEAAAEAADTQPAESDSLPQRVA